MHAAPPVRMACKEGGWRRLHALAVAGAAAVFVVWACRWLGVDGAAAAAAAVVAAGTGGLLALRTMEQRCCELDWDGQRWHIAGAGAEAGGVEVVFDLGRWMFLRWRAMPGGSDTRWLTVRRDDAGGAWAAWRAALYGPVPRAEAAPPRR